MLTALTDGHCSNLMFEVTKMKTLWGRPEAALPWSKWSLSSFRASGCVLIWWLQGHMFSLNLQRCLVSLSVYIAASSLSLFTLTRAVRVAWAFEGSYKGKLIWRYTEFRLSGVHVCHRHSFLSTVMGLVAVQDGHSSQSRPRRHLTGQGNSKFLLYRYTLKSCS